MEIHSKWSILLAVVSLTALWSLLFSVSLRVSIRDFESLFKKPGLLLRSLFAILIIAPLVALAVSFDPHLPRHARLAILLLAAAPGAPLTSQKSIQVGTPAAMALGVQVIVSILAVVTTPFTVWFFGWFYSQEVWISPLLVLRQIAVLLFVPLSAGLFLRAYRPELADRLAYRISVIANGGMAILAMFAGLFGIWLAVEIGLRSALPICLVSIASLMAGHVLGGPNRQFQSAIAITSVTRSGGLALLIAKINFPKDAELYPVLFCIFVNAVAGLAYLRVQKKIVS